MFFFLKGSGSFLPFPSFPSLPDKKCHRHYTPVISGKAPMGCHDHSGHVHHLVPDDLKAAKTDTGATFWTRSCHRIWRRNNSVRNFSLKQKILKLHLDLRANSLFWYVQMQFHVIPCYSSRMQHNALLKCNIVQSPQPLSILIPEKPKKPVVGSRAFQRLFWCAHTCHRVPMKHSWNRSASERPTVGSVGCPRLMASSKQQRDIRHAPTAILMRSLLKFNIIAKNPVALAREEKVESLALQLDMLQSSHLSKHPWNTLNCHISCFGAIMLMSPSPSSA